MDEPELAAPAAVREPVASLTAASPRPGAVLLTGPPPGRAVWLSWMRDNQTQSMHLVTKYGHGILGW